MTTTPPERLLTVDQLAEALGVPKATVYKWTHEGTAPRSYKVGRHLRFKADDVATWLESKASEPQPAA